MIKICVGILILIILVFLYSMCKLSGQISREEEKVIESMIVKVDDKKYLERPKDKYLER